MHWMDISQVKKELLAVNEHSNYFYHCCSSHIKYISNWETKPDAHSSLLYNSHEIHIHISSRREKESEWVRYYIVDKNV